MSKDERSPLLDNLLDQSGEDVAPPLTKWQAFYKKFFIHILVAWLVVITVTEKVLAKVMTNRLENYTYFLTQLLSLVYIPIMFGVVWYKQRNTNEITEAMLRYPKWKYFIMAIFDALAGLAMVVLPHMSGPLVTLLQQSTVPVSLIMSVLILKKRYRWSHYLGAAVIIVGIILYLLPQLINPSKDDKENARDSNLPLYATLLFASSIPAVGGKIYQEISLKQEMNVYLLNGWVALFQFFIGLPLAPLFFKVQTPSGDLSHLGENLRHSFGCVFAGVNYEETDQCSYGILFFVIYIGLNIAFNIVMTYVLLYGSAVLVFIAITIAVPFTYFMFSWDVVEDPPLSITGYSIGGLLVTVAGLVLFYWKREPEPEIHQDTEAILADGGVSTINADEQSDTMSSANLPRFASSVPQRSGSMASVNGPHSPGASLSRGRSGSISPTRELLTRSWSGTGRMMVVDGMEQQRIERPSSLSGSRPSSFR